MFSSFEACEQDIIKHMNDTPSRAKIINLARWLYSLNNVKSYPVNEPGVRFFKNSPGHDHFLCVKYGKRSAEIHFYNFIPRSSPLQDYMALQTDNHDWIRINGGNITRLDFETIQQHARQSYRKRFGKEPVERNVPPMSQGKTEVTQATNPIGDDKDIKPVPLDFSAILEAAPRRGGGGESENHRRLKEFVAAHPEAIGLPKGTPKGTPEYPLPSGDSLDVFFEHADTWVGVEVKSALSDEADMVRGLFQCVKYQAVMEAVQRAKTLLQNARTILVLEGKLPSRLLPLKNILGVEVAESISPE